MTSGNVWKAGRVVIDDRGIAHKLLWGRRFKLQWSDIFSWNVKDMALLDRSTGKERITRRLLCFFHRDGMNVISRPVGDKQFPLIVDRVRRHLPDKEPKPPWIAYPGTAPFRGGWRQGFSEWWIRDVWFPFWKHLTPDEKDAYLTRYPAPDDDWLLYLTHYWR